MNCLWGLFLITEIQRQRYTRNTFMAYFSSVIMDFILPFSVKKPLCRVGLRQPLLLMGSCFTEAVGAKLAERRFDALINPHGILYNPISLSEALTDYRENKKYGPKDIFQFNETWRSYKHHGKFSGTSADACINNINPLIEKAHGQIKKGGWLVITFGSAFIYRHKKTDQWVGNCHKIPSAEFDKELLSKEEIAAEWKKQIAALQKLNPALNIIFTVSPVRYVRDGLIENNRSKGILIDAAHTLVEQHDNCFYFPAYELVIDVLRDYRFYTEDMVHPNEAGVNYVWEKFVESFCDDKTKKFIEEYEPLLKGLQHRPFQEDTQAHKKFKADLVEKIKALDEKYL